MTGQQAPPGATIALPRSMLPASSSGFSSEPSGSIAYTLPDGIA